MQGDCITVPLGLPEVEVLSQRELPGGRIAVRVMARAEVRSCPACSHITAKVHDRREQAKADVSVAGRQVVLIVLRRRFRCPFCKKVFTEPDEVCGWRRRLTRRLREEIGRAAHHSTVKAVAASRGVSQETVRRALAEEAGREGNGEAEPVRHLGMDDFSVRRGLRYQTGFYDLDGRRVLGVVEGRTAEAVGAFLRALAEPEAVEAVTMDMSGAYRSAVEEDIPWARIVADKFHVIKRVGEQLTKLRIRLQDQADAKAELYKARYLLARKGKELSLAERRRLWALLKAYPELRRGYRLKEDFGRWYRPRAKTEARAELRAWTNQVAEEGPAEFAELLWMLNAWREEILNYFEFGLTNAFAEGKNTRTRAIQRQAYGYRNLANLNLRILLPCA